MDIKIEKKTPTEGYIKINLKEGDYQQKVDQKVRDYARQANIPGFRKGKVPTGMIRKLYGKSIKADEINHILSHALSDYIKENDIRLIGDPIPEVEKTKSIDWENQSEFEFEYHVGLVDKFDYDLSPKTKVKKYIIQADKKAVEQTIDEVRSQHGKVQNPDQSQEGDALFGHIKMNDSDKENDALLEPKDIQKKAQKQLVGVRKDQSIEFDLRKTLTDDVAIARLFSVTIDEAKKLKGKAVFSVKNVNRTIPADLDTALFDKLFGPGKIKSESEFRDKVKETIEQNYARESESLLDVHIQKTLVEKTKINIPSDFLKRWLVFTNKGELLESEIEKDYPKYEDELKWNLVHSRIAEDHKIVVENQQVIDEARNQIMNQLGGPSVAEAFADKLDGIVNNYLQAEEGKNYMNIYNYLRGTKIFELIKEKITISEKKVSLDEFKKIASR